VEKTPEDRTGNICFHKVISVRRSLTLSDIDITVDILQGWLVVSLVYFKKNGLGGMGECILCIFDRRDSQRLGVDQPSSRRSSNSSAVSDVTEAENSERPSKEKRRQKSLTWRNKLKDDEPNVQDCLLQQDTPVSQTQFLRNQPK